jgi:glycosyltransferase involved in cell wall biosynthesis
MMKVAICHPFLYHKSGADKVILKIAQHYNAKVYCVKFDREATFEGFENVEVLNPPMKSILNPLLSLLPLRVRDSIIAGITFFFAKLEPYDAIITFGTPSEWIANRNKNVIWYCLSPNREVFDLHQERQANRSTPQKILFELFSIPYSLVENYVIPKMKKIFSISHTVEQRLNKYLNIETEILYPAIAPSEFSCKSYNKFFFYPSRFAPEKRFEYVIEAFREFKKHDTNSWKLILAGAVLKERKEQQEYYETIAKARHGSSGCIEVFPNVSNMEMSFFYSNCGAVLFAGRDEDFGLIPLEAGASSKPIISVNEGGARETIIDGVTGFLVDSELGMADKMQFVSENTDWAREMGEAGNEHILSKFSWDAFFERLDNEIKKG